MSKRRRREEALGRRRMRYFAAGFGALILAVVFLLVQGGARRSGEIVLAQTAADGAASGDVGEGSGGPRRVRLTPETVQLAINTLSRPGTYSRSQMVETFWSGGKGESIASVAVSGSRTRVDMNVSGGVRHMLVQGGQAAVWYDNEMEWTVLRSEDFTADIAARMPTYETVLLLPVAEILEADYQDRDGVGCIYVATAETEDGYADRYWISVSSGLLAAAERTWNGELVYRFTASPLDPDPPEDSLFLLPDGSVLE